MLSDVINAILDNGKGILAADESNSTAGKRLADIGLENSEENRRAMREMLFTTPQARNYIGGVILYDETIHQADSQGKPFVQDMFEAGVIPGIKVDQGLVAYNDSEVEKITEGLESLSNRLPEYKMLGAKFAKWRAVYTVSQDGKYPTAELVEEASARLAKYAKVCQGQDIVPIVEPEVLMEDGEYSSHDMQRCAEVTKQVNQMLFAKLDEYQVDLSGILLKPNMVVAGKNCQQQGSVEEVATATLQVLKEVVPAVVGGIVFLSGGQTPQQATQHLNAINKLGDAPWKLSFSYGRALQQEALQAWAGNDLQAGQDKFLEVAQANSLAAQGKL